VKPKEECVRERKRTYELMFIISSMHADDEGVANIINRVQESIEAQGGEVLSVNHNAPWGHRRLAYPIRAYAGGESSRRIFTEGFYVLMHMSLLSSKVVDVERTMKLADPILRYLVTVVEQTGQVPGFGDAMDEGSEVDADDVDTDDEEADNEDGEAADEAEDTSGDAELVEEDAS
jgi:small subunit ribosomal protein S6